VSSSVGSLIGAINFSRFGVIKNVRRCVTEYMGTWKAHQVRDTQFTGQLNMLTMTQRLAGGLPIRINRWFK